MAMHAGSSPSEQGRVAAHPSSRTGKNPGRSRCRGVLPTRGGTSGSCARGSRAGSVTHEEAVSFDRTSTQKARMSTDQGQRSALRRLPRFRLPQDSDQVRLPRRRRDPELDFPFSCVIRVKSSLVSYRGAHLGRERRESSARGEPRLPHQEPARPETGAPATGPGSLAGATVHPLCYMSANPRKGYG